MRAARTAISMLGVPVALAALLGGGLAAHASASATHPATSAPRVLTGAAREIGEGGFELAGTVTTGGLPTSYYFLYKLVGSVECEDLEGCGSNTEKAELAGGAGKERVRLATAAELQAGKYEFWLVAHNKDGTAVGMRHHFTAR